MHKNGSEYGLKEITAEARESILEFAGVRLRVRHADADEPIDPITLHGYLAVWHGIPVTLTECLGFACPTKSDECEICPLNTDKQEDLAFEFAFAKRSVPSFAPVFQSRHDAMYDLCSAAPMSRGSRAFAESSFFRRMRF